MRYLLLLLSTLGMILAGPSEVKPFGPETWFVQDALPHVWGPDSAACPVKGNPLDYAAARIGLDIRNVELPRGWEGGYRYCCRFPIIDAVANRPLYMKQWAEENSAMITRLHRDSGLAALTGAIRVLRGCRWNHGVFLRAAFPDETLFSRKIEGSNFTSAYRDALTRLYRGVADARAYVALDELDDSVKARFDANPGYFLAPDGRKMPELTGDNSTELAFTEWARRVDVGSISFAGEVLAWDVADYVRRTRNLRIDEIFVDTSKSRERFTFETPIGTMIVAGTGNDTFREDAAILIDLGGDDVYLNNAGGCRSSKNHVALCIDHSGNDQYLTPDRSYVQGFGFLGVGMLVDMAGNDRYVAKHFSQGAGIVGVGALWDLGGDDVYEGQTFVQGAGMFGLGMLLDDAGNDHYDGASLCQGAATTMGLGILSDLEGDDSYGLALKPGYDALGQLPGYGQGGALSFRPAQWSGKLTAYGGIGMLIDDYGNDRYESKGWCDQGGSYIMSLGVLCDNHGNDHYSAGTGQGSSIHVTNGILIDREGDDVYEGGFRTGGGAGDRSPAFLIDYAGDDTYKASSSCYGTSCKPFGIGLMIDYSGDDKYIAPEPKDGVVKFNNWQSFGGVWPESESYDWPWAICLDLGGKDDYQVRHHENNSELSSFGHGIHLDMEWKGGDVIGKVDNPLQPYPGVPTISAMPAHQYLKDVLQLKDPDNFRRFQAVGRIVDIGPDVIPVLVSVLMQSDHRQFNRDVLECLHYFMVKGPVTGKEASSVSNLLRAQDPEVRTVIADDFGVFKLDGGEDALIAALKDSVASVRRFALRSLMTLKSIKGSVAAREVELPTKDPSEDVRRVATRYVSRVVGMTDVKPLLLDVLERDAATSPRVMAAGELGWLGDTSALGPLRKAAQSPDVYLQRAAGRAMADLGDVGGVQVLISSLSFPSIDAFFNYDRNVPNDIAAYTNYDLPDSTRYAQSAWQQWFAQNRDRIDIIANTRANHDLAAMQDTLLSAPETLQVKAGEELLKKHPGYRRIVRALASQLNGVAWNMVTAAKTSAGYDAAKGLKLARRAVELDSNPEYIDTEAEALEANGMTAEAIKLCEETLKKYPDNQMFLDRLKRLVK